MATTLAVQSVFSSPVTQVTKANNVGVNQFFSAKYASAGLQRNSGFTVRCMSEDKKQTKSVPKKMSTRFSDLLAFSGPAPERINGRLAMVGFVAALAVELSKGQDVLDQISNGTGVTWFVGTSILLSVASLIPLFKGVSVESKSDGVMTSDAEMLNGRLAMLGLVALALTEFVKGSTLV